jgi:hypothetical protein
VIALGQGRLEIGRKGLEASEMVGPFPGRQAFQPNDCRSTRVAPAQAELREVRGSDGIGELAAEGREPGIRGVVRRDRHRVDMAAARRRRKT